MQGGAGMLVVNLMLRIIKVIVKVTKMNMLGGFCNLYAVSVVQLLLYSSGSK